MKVHEFQMASMRKMKELSGQIDAQMIEDDSLARAFPKKMAGHSSDDLKGAEDRLDAIQSAMDNWMTMPHPNDPAMGHEEAMNALMKEKRELESATADALAAIDSATSALAAHRRFADALLAAGTKPSGKGRH